MPLVATLFAVAFFAWPGTAGAHGTLDQTLEGDPGCNTTNFASSVTASSGQRQSFIPTGSQLISVALCVSAAAPNTPLVVAIYTAGGVLVGGGSTASNPSIPDAAGPPVRFVHVDFQQPYAVTPGATYVIENVSGVPITWYGTTAASPYTYCQGAPNTSAVVDFGFQSFLVDSPGSPAPCAPVPTNTPVPAPTNTPSPPTNTPAPGETAAPTSTPAPGTTIVPSATAPAGTTSGNGAPSSAGGANPSPAGSVSSGNPSGLPGSGGGPRNPSPPLSLWLLSGFVGAVLLAAGVLTQRRARSAGRR